jgi:Dyp-type peroxidase family
VEADELARFPQEFRDGAEARAPQLGDQRLSHPRNWKLPPRNWPEGQAGFVKLDRIDVLIQLRVNGAGAAVHDFFERDGSGSPVHPLFAAVSGLATGAGKKGLRLVSVTPMLAASAGAGASGLDHFGLMDGISQPEPKDQPPPLASGWTNETAMGAFVIGQPDGSGDRLPTTSAGLREGGSFLVVRRMRQHRDRFEALVAKAMAQSNRPRQLVIEKMLGRGEDGSSPVSASANDFDYSGDPTGAKCPLQSHIRRANPRLPGGPLKAPRLMRRGMSFGPRVNGPASWSQERGVMFMAYCASLAEQFEVIQRWVNGGNSTRIGSFLTDPLMGVPRRKDRRTFRFEVDGRVYRIDLNPDDLPAITLEWMAYFFVPGLPALRNLGDFAGAPAARTDTAATEGQQLVGMLLQEGEAAREKWQVVLDDAGSRVAGVTATAWAGVRTGPPQPESAAWAPGVVRCPYGTRSDTTLLVGSDALMREVLDPSSDAGQAVSVGGYNGRAKDSMGEIYLGLDPGERYDEESVVPNDAISAVSRDRAFALALAAGQQALQRLLAGQAKVSGPVTVYFDAVFAILCRTYFDVPDGQNIVPGGLDFRDVGSRRPICPGDYYSPSRYMFDPTPSDEGVRMGKAHGNALFEATKALAKDGMAWNGIISKPIADQLLTRPAADVQLFARTHVGVMMGFLPTCWGSLIGIFDDWMASGALWDRQDALVVTQGWGQLAPMLAQIGAAALLQPQNAAAILQAAAVHPVLAGADAVLDLAMRQAMQRRPAPDFIWRTARKAGSLGGVAFKKGDVLALSIYSVTLELQGKGDFSVMPIFGGTRGTGRPTHACPGYEMAMGTLLGTITALLSFANLRPATGPLTLELSSRLQG